jgi:hypothetical protein
VLEKIVAKIPVGRLGMAEEIARGVAFLTSENGGFMTGSTMSINGGQHMYERRQAASQRVGGPSPPNPSDVILRLCRRPHAALLATGQAGAARRQI